MGEIVFSCAVGNLRLMSLLGAVLLGLFLADPGAEAQKGKDERSAKSASEAEVKDPVQKEYQKLLEMDEASLREYEKIMEEATAFEAQGAPIPRAVLIARIDRAIEPVVKAYEEFVKKHPEHVDGRIAFGSFLQEIGDEAAAIEQLEKARDLAPENPTPWNNLANIYGHIGPVRKAFHYYTKAIELEPTEPVYVHNLAITTYLFRKDAMEMYRISEEEVFNKALDLYRQAMKLDPDNFLLATDYAQSYYGIRPTRVKEALGAWEQALALAKNDLEKQGIYMHFARIELNNGLFEEAEKHLEMVTHPDLQELKERLERNLEKERDKAEDKKPALKEGKEISPKNGGAVKEN